MEKSKAAPDVRSAKADFYRHGCYFHFKHGMKALSRPDTELLVTSASIGSKKERIAFELAMADAIGRTCHHMDWHTDFRPSQADPCLQLADYCAWAIQRKWERGDERSYRLIRDRITYEYDLWSHAAEHYY